MTSKTQKIFTYINIAIVGFLTFTFSALFIYSWTDGNYGLFENEYYGLLIFLSFVLHFGFSLPLITMVVKSKERISPKISLIHAILNLTSACMPVLTFIVGIISSFSDVAGDLVWIMISLGTFVLLGLYIATIVLFIILQVRWVTKKQVAPVQENAMPVRQFTFNNNFEQNSQHLFNNQPNTNQNVSEKPAAPTTPSAPKYTEAELDDQLEKLCELFNKGKISKEEFQKREADILAKY